MTAPAPALAMAAPDKAPIRAWDELVGSPRYQVIKFHRTAPNRPLKIMGVSTTSNRTMPVPIVVAT